MAKAGAWSLWLTNTYPGAGFEPYHIAAGSDGAMWFAHANSSGIGRITTAVTPAITCLMPASGAAGDQVTITGQNLSGAARVAFNGTDAAIVSGSATSITARVPAGASTGPITVTTPAGTATSTSAFTVS